MSLLDVRREFDHSSLREEEVASDPLVQFRLWLDQAQSADPQEFTAMTLATVDAAGHPAARIVLLKGVDDRGFVFFTNYESRKGRELAANPRAALVFYWAPFDRQVRVEGVVERTSRAETAEYFSSRPLGSQLGAWASRQSAPIASRAELEGELAAVTERFAEGAVPVPDFWGGYRLRPEAIEFWQGRPNRLHDRLRYSRPLDLGNEGAGVWTLERLAP